MIEDQSKDLLFYAMKKGISCGKFHDSGLSIVLFEKSINPSCNNVDFHIETGDVARSNDVLNHFASFSLGFTSIHSLKKESNYFIGLLDGLHRMYFF